MTKTTHNRATDVWTLLGLLVMLMTLLTLVWPDRAEGHPSTIPFSEVETSGRLSSIRTAITPSFLDDHLTATARYTSYLPIVTNASLPEPLNTLLVLINTERQKYRLPPLKINLILMQVAQAHSQSMADNRFFDHIDPATGMNPCERIASAGYAFYTCAENIAAGYHSADAVFQAWMSSPSHSSNLLSPDFTEIGMGYAAGGLYHYYWTVNLARPR